MKKIILTVVLVLSLLILASPAWATWTLVVSGVTDAGHYMKWKVVCTSDGAALSATNMFGVTGANHLRLGQGETLMLMKVSPGTGSVIPNTTINITLTDNEGDAVWADTGISKDAISWHDMSEDIAAYIPVLGKLYLTLNDIGDSGDQVTLYFISWRE